MALSNSVVNSLNDAEASLRNALAFAARGERPTVCKTISDLICNIEQMKSIDEIFDKLEGRKRGDSGRWGPLNDIGE